MGSKGSKSASVKMPAGHVRGTDGLIVAWEYAATSETDWKPFDNKLAMQLEDAHSRELPEVDIRISGTNYVIKFSLWLQVNKSSGTVRPVRRRVAGDAAAVDELIAGVGDSGDVQSVVDQLARQASAGRLSVHSGSARSLALGSGAGGAGDAGVGGGEGGAVPAADAAPKLRTRRCRNWRRGTGCRFGPSCWFYHEGQHDVSSTRPPLRCIQDFAGHRCTRSGCTALHAITSESLPSAAADATTPPPPPAAVPSLLRARSEASRECVVCMDAPREMTLVHGRTGHFIVCEVCADSLMGTKDRECPMCRERIEKVIRTYF